MVGSLAAGVDRPVVDRPVVDRPVVDRAEVEGTLCVCV